MTDDDFYIYLPSNTEFLPTNKSNNYVTKLAKEISLSGRWQVCLKEIHYPRTWATLTHRESSFVFVYGDDDDWREVTIDSGHYRSERALVNAITNAIGEDGVTVGFSQSSKRTKVKLPEGSSIHFTEPLSSMLGIGYGTVVCTSAMRRGRFPIDLSRGIDSLYVYSDVVRTKLVGNTSAPLLSVVPVSGSYGQMSFKEYSNPVYTDLSRNTFSTIELYLMDSAARYIPFEFGKVTVLLHFKKIQ